MKSRMIKIFLLSLFSISLLLSAGCGNSAEGKNGEVIVYNWGEYLDPETIRLFEDETGIKVIYDEFETNEVMFPKVEAGATEYDVICPSDYMIQNCWKMIYWQNLILTISRMQKPISASNTGSNPQNLTRKINIPFLTAGEP